MTLGDDDSLRWQGAIVARLRPGATVLAPRLQLELDPTLDAAAQDRVRRRLDRWLDSWIDERLGALARLRQAARGDGLTGAGRGIAYRLVEQHGTMRRAEADSLVRDLAQPDRKALARLGVRFGQHHVFMPDLLKPAASEARTRLLRIFHGRPQSLPPPGRTVLRPPFPAQGEAMLSLGFALFDGFAVRVDILERIAAQIRARARDSVSFSVPPTMAAEAGLTRGELGELVEALGFRPEAAGGRVAYTRPPAAARRTGGTAPDQCRPRPARRLLSWPVCGWRRAHERRPAARQMAVAGSLYPQPALGRQPGGGTAGAAERADRRQDPPAGPPG